MVPRNRWQDDRVIRADGGYAKWAEEAAKQSGALFIDLNDLVASRFERMGKDAVAERLFTATDWTHTTLAGAKVNAQAVVEDIKSLEDCALATFLKPNQNHVSSAPGDIQFIFGDSESSTDIKLVEADDLYNSARGFGFEPGVEIDNVTLPSNTGCKSSEPFYFSVKLPEGNYRVNVLSASTPLTVKAELRRLMYWHNEMTQPSPSPAEFTVNVRTTRINDQHSVRLKPREEESEFWAWDEKLTLEFNGPHPTVHSLSISPEQEAITVFLTGDSTVTDQPSGPWGSWGQMLPYFFQPGVAVANYAQSGESVASSLGAGRFEKVFSLMKPGDHLLIQFGHNDMKNKQPNALNQYRENLVKIVKRTKYLGGVPVLVTSMERKPGRGYVSLGDYPQAVREIAAEHHVPLIDLNAMSRTLYDALSTNLDYAFQDGSHHTVYGSYLLAKCVAKGIIDNRLTLAPLLNDRILWDFEPSRPDARGAC